MDSGDSFEDFLAASVDDEDSVVVGSTRGGSASSRYVPPAAGRSDARGSSDRASRSTGGGSGYRDSMGYGGGGMGYGGGGHGSYRSPYSSYAMGGGGDPLAAINLDALPKSQRRQPPQEREKRSTSANARQGESRAAVGSRPSVQESRARESAPAGGSTKARSTSFTFDRPQDDEDISPKRGLGSSAKKARSADPPMSRIGSDARSEASESGSVSQSQDKEPEAPSVFSSFFKDLQHQLSSVEEFKKSQQEDEVRRVEQEEQARKQREEAERARIEAELQKRALEEEAEMLRKEREAEEERKRQEREEEERKRKEKEEEEARKKKEKEEEEERERERKAKEEEEEKRRLKEKAEEDERKRREQEAEEKRKKEQEEKERKERERKEEEEARKKKQEEEEKKQAALEAERKRNQEEEDQKRKEKEEEEARKKKEQARDAEEEKRRDQEKEQEDKRRQQSVVASAREEDKQEKQTERQSKEWEDKEEQEQQEARREPQQREETRQEELPAADKELHRKGRDEDTIPSSPKAEKREEATQGHDQEELEKRRHAEEEALRIKQEKLLAEQKAREQEEEEAQRKRREKLLKEREEAQERDLERKRQEEKEKEERRAAERKQRMAEQREAEEREEERKIEEERQRQERLQRYAEELQRLHEEEEEEEERRRSREELEKQRSESARWQESPAWRKEDLAASRAATLSRIAAIAPPLPPTATPAAPAPKAPSVPDRLLEAVRKREPMQSLDGDSVVNVGSNPGSHAGGGGTGYNTARESDTYAKLKTELEITERMLRGFEKENENLVIQNRQLREASRKRQEEMDERHLQIVAELNAARASADTNPASMRRVSELERELALAKDRAKELAVELERARESNRVLERELLSGPKPADNPELATQLEAVTAAARQAESDVAELKEKLRWYAEGQQEMEQDRQEVTRLHDEVSMLRSENAELRRKPTAKDSQRRIAELRAQVEELQECLRKRHPDSILALMKACEPAPEEKREVRNLRKRVEELETKLGETEELHDRQLRSLRARYDHLRQAYEKRAAAKPASAAADQGSRAASEPRVGPDREAILVARVKDLERQVEHTKSYYLSKLRKREPLVPTPKPARTTKASLGGGAPASQAATCQEPPHRDVACEAALPIPAELSTGAAAVLGGSFSPEPLHVDQQCCRPAPTPAIEVDHFGRLLPQQQQQQNHPAAPFQAWASPPPPPSPLSVAVPPAAQLAAEAEARARSAQMQAENTSLRGQVLTLTNKCQELTAQLSQGPVQVVRKLQADIADLQARLHEQHTVQATAARMTEITLRSELDIARHEALTLRAALEAKDKEMFQHQCELDEIMTELLSLRSTRSPSA